MKKLSMIFSFPLKAFGFLCLLLLFLSCSGESEKSGNTRRPITPPDEPSCTSGVGDGLSVENPIIICNYDELNNIRNDLNENNQLNKHYALGRDIDAKPSWSQGSQGCVPYNEVKDIDSSNPCSGWIPLPEIGPESSFDGQGYKISYLYIHSDQYGVGMFSSYTYYEDIDSSRVIIKNLHLRSIRVSSTQTQNPPFGVPESPGAGGIIGILSVEEDVVRGLLGGEIEGCSVYGKLTSPRNTGGIIGVLRSGTLVNSYANVTVEGQVSGGLVGLNYGHIYNSHSKGSILTSGGAGGVSGNTGSDEDTGCIYYSYSKASISSQGTGNRALGSVTGLLAGSCLNSSYGVGAVSSGHDHRGGLIGELLEPQLSRNNFWDIETTGQLSSPTDSSVSSTGLTTEQMKSGCEDGQVTTPDICNLGEAFYFESGSYPKIKKCIICDGDNSTFSDELVGGQ